MLKDLLSNDVACMPKNLSNGATPVKQDTLKWHMLCSHRSASSKNKTKTNMPLVLLVLELSKNCDAAL